MAACLDYTPLFPKGQGKRGYMAKKRLKLAPAVVDSVGETVDDVGQAEEKRKNKNVRQQAIYGKSLAQYGLTPKQLTFVVAYVEGGGNGTRAALRAYETTDSRVALSIASENLTKPSVKRALSDLLLKQMATPEAAVAKFSQLMHSSENEKIQLDAAENVAKIHSLFKQKKEIDKKVTIVQIGLPQSQSRRITDIDAIEIANISEE